MKPKGFTLIELVVVMAVFLIIIGTALGIFISIVQNQKRILAQKEILNQASYALEYMSKGMRMAKKAADNGCITAGRVYELAPAEKKIKFINQSDDNACQEFYLESNAGLGYILTERKNGGSAVQVTSASLEIKDLQFILNGNPGLEFVPVQGDENQPRVTIYLDLKSAGENNQPLYAQTTVSQRDLNKQNE